MKILVVEDAPLLRKMYGLAFSTHHHELHQAANGREALAALRRAHASYDLILLDLRMPDMNGVEFIQTARQDAVLGSIPIVVTTAEADDSELLAQAKALGVAAVVKKPWRPAELRQTVERLLG